LWFASIRIPAGHRLGLQVASSHFPAFDRNLNTGGDNYTGTEWVVATNAVHHGPTRASALVLQVRPT
jgi:predicted acyl esterase